MNAIEQAVCNCTPCPGSGCTCGCKQAAAQDAGVCGAQCQCGQSCACARS